MEKEQLTFSIDKNKADQLRKLAYKEDRSLSNMVRFLLEDILDKRKDFTEKAI